MTGDRLQSVETSTGLISSPALRQFVATDMNDIVHTVVGCTRPYLSGHTVLSIETCGDLPPIRGNQERLADVLFALLFRAERSIAIAARTTSMIRIQTTATDRDVRLKLSDDGFDSGIGETLIPDPCLGLTECAEIISDHGGRMYSWHPNAGGASYTIILPVL